MLLKRIELDGFKSFADSTNVTFEPSITAIVGPNGSGKSNIVDAIRWVLGEQSAKSLRGSKMEDIIFAGTKERRPMKIAEVRLVLDNSDGTLPIEYSEVSIGRRVDRSGSSDYILNGNVCRLKDIDELLMDTGMGKESYSIVGQGKIDTILSSKPADRRGLFEEAAGIIKYKTRKKETTKKLEEVEGNLTRVDDIVQELERQAGPLKKQAEDARKYKKYKGELTELNESLLLTNWSRYHTEIATYKDDRDRLAENLKKREDMVTLFESKVDELKGELEDIKKLIEEKQEKYYQLRTRRETMENKIEMFHEKLEGLHQQKKRIEEDIKEQKDSLNGYDKEKESIRDSIKGLEDERKEINRFIEESERRREELAEEITANRDKIDNLKDNLMEYLNQRNELQNNLSRFKEQKSDLEKRLEELVQIRDNNDRDLDSAVTELKEIKNELNQTNQRLDYLKEETDRVEEIHQDDQEKLQQAQDEFTSFRDDLQGAKSRLKVLQDMEDSLQGYYKGVKTVIRAKDNNRLSGIVGVVAELLEVDKDKEKAIGSALGGRLQNVIVETGENAKDAVAYLKKNRGGRATFLPLDMVKGREMNLPSHVASIDGCLGVASDFVEADNRLKSIVNYLLGRIIIAKDMDSALKISRAGKNRFKIVTMDGDNINPGGAVSGGSSHKHNNNLLGRSREIEELTTKANGLREKLTELKESGQKLKQKVIDQTKQLKEWQDEIHQLELKRANLIKDEEQLKKDTEQQETLLSNVDQEFEESRQKLDQYQVQIEKLTAELESLNNENAQQEVELKELENGVQKKRNEIETIKQEITDKRIKLASFDEQEKGYHNRLDQIDDLKVKISDKLEQLDEEIEEKDIEIHWQKEDIKELEEKAVEAREKEDAAHQKVKDLKQTEEDLLGAHKKEESRARKARKKVKELSQELNKYEVKIAELKSKLENIKEELNEEHGIDVSKYEDGQIEMIDNIEKVEKRIKSLKWKLRVLGSVNLAAEEEYADLKERLGFLKEQHEDLTNAQQSLLETISELDEIIKERFFNTFNQVKDEFEESFVKLFGGGSAELSLSDPEDLLETGIEINAQPPGKKLQKLTLMSGGEKALTALALIFAFLKVKPSPFYILDEIDAPLDEANVERYANFVREFSETSQFIIVTHRKRTMAEADALYGVTMEESGVSKLISYRLADSLAEKIS